MKTPPIIEYDKFISLNGLNLCHYMEPLVNDTTTQVSTDILQRMRSELPAYDEYHLAYALTLGAKHSPKSFAMQLPLYLAHEHGSVWSTALRSLEQLPDEYVTEALVNLVRHAVSLYPEKTWIKEVLDKLEKQLRYPDRASLDNRTSGKENTEK